MKKYWIEIEDRCISFYEVIKHTKDNLDFVKNNKATDCENLDALIVNIKNALVVLPEDVNNIDRADLSKYIKDLKSSRAMINFFVNKAINNVESIIASLPKDNYDSMSKEELIALLRNK